MNALQAAFTIVWCHLYLWFTKNDIKAAMDHRAMLEHELSMAPKIIRRFENARAEKFVQIAVARNQFRLKR